MDSQELPVPHSKYPDGVALVLAALAAVAALEELEELEEPPGEKHLFRPTLCCCPFPQEWRRQKNNSLPSDQRPQFLQRRGWYLHWRHRLRRLRPSGALGSTFDHQPRNTSRCGSGGLQQRHGTSVRQDCPPGGLQPLGHVKLCHRWW